MSPELLLARAQRPQYQFGNQPVTATQRWTWCRMRLHQASPRWLPCIRWECESIRSVHDRSAGWEVQVRWTHGSPFGWTARTGR